MYSGLGRRNEPHAERKYQAIQAIELHYGPPENRKIPRYPIKDGGARTFTGSEAKL